MREIKFRAWDGKKMHYQVRFGGVKDGIPLSPSVWDEKIGWTILSGDPVLEIMQFTGLYDKNSKEIYEGDIVECFVNGNSYVSFKGGVYGLIYDYSFIPFSDIHGEMKVIGNIYENHELLEGKNESNKA